MLARSGSYPNIYINRKIEHRTGRMLSEGDCYEKKGVANYVFSFFLAVLGFS